MPRHACALEDARFSRARPGARRGADRRRRLRQEWRGRGCRPWAGGGRGAGGRRAGGLGRGVGAEEGLLAETKGVPGSRVSPRAGGGSVGGSLTWARGRPPAEGVLSHGGRRYQYTSFGG